MMFISGSAVLIQIDLPHFWFITGHIDVRSSRITHAATAFKGVKQIGIKFGFLIVSAAFHLNSSKSIVPFPAGVGADRIEIPVVCLLFYIFPGVVRSAVGNADTEIEIFSGSYIVSDGDTVTAPRTF
jgi:hypothetical protein